MILSHTFATLVFGHLGLSVNGFPSYLERRNGLLRTVSRCLYDSYDSIPKCSGRLVRVGHVVGVEKNRSGGGGNRCGTGASMFDARCPMSDVLCPHERAQQMQARWLSISARSHAPGELFASQPATFAKPD